MEIYDRIRELRVKAGFTQSDIASYLHTDVSYYSKYERGLHPIPVRHLKSLCELYHVSADYILDLPISYDCKKNNAFRRFFSSILNKTLFLFNYMPAPFGASFPFCKNRLPVFSGRRFFDSAAVQLCPSAGSAESAETAKQYRRLGPAGGTLRQQRSRSSSLENSCINRPGHGFPGIGRHCCSVTEPVQVGICGESRALPLGKAVEQHRQLLTGHGGTGGGTVGNSGRHGPGLGGLHVGGINPLHPGQNHPNLLTADAAAGGKDSFAGALHVSLFQRPGDLLPGPEILRDI